MRTRMRISVARRVLDVAVAEIGLNGPRISAAVGELVAGRVAQLVRMHPPREASGLADPG